MAGSSLNMIYTESELNNYMNSLQKLAVNLNKIGYNKYNPLFNHFYKQVKLAQAEFKLEWIN